MTAGQHEPTSLKDNPMNLLLFAAYETMWRAVMRCFLEVRCRNAPNGPAWSTILTNYLDALQNVDTQQKAFHHGSRGGVKPLGVVKEALHLYPPTRRVHRVFDGSDVSADIEECQRFSILGGDDPLAFRPERWQEICPEERAAKDKKEKSKIARDEKKLGFMLFAHSCPAGDTRTKGFGFKMIALLVAVLCAGLEDWDIKGGEDLPQLGKALLAERQAYEDLLLEKL
jgi:hypothetical protein